MRPRQAKNEVWILERESLLLPFGIVSILILFFWNQWWVTETTTTGESLRARMIPVLPVYYMLFFCIFNVLFD